MTLEELRYHHWEPISVTLNRETVSGYVHENNFREVPAEIFLSLECGRIINTLLNCSEQVILASSSLDIKKTLPIGATVIVSTHVSDLRRLKGQAYVTIKQDYYLSDQLVAELTQIMTLKT